MEVRRYPTSKEARMKLNDRQILWVVQTADMQPHWCRSQDAAQEWMRKNGLQDDDPSRPGYAQVHSTWAPVEAAY